MSVISIRNRVNFQSPLWKYSAVLYLLVISFPGDFQAIRPGLDASWKYALNYLTQTNFVFGRDFVHPYGPLGYLIQPLNIGSNLLHATIFRLFIHGIFAACLFFYAHKAGNALPILAFAVGYAISLVAVLALEFSYHLLVVVSLLLCVSLKDKRLSWVAAPACGALAAAILFMKFGIGIVAAAIIASAAITWIVGNQQGAWKVVLLAAGSYLSTVAILAAIYLQSTQHLVSLIDLSLNMSDGYSVAQSRIGRRQFVTLALLAFAAYVWLVFSLHKQKSDLRYIAPLFALAMFLAFKHGFVQVSGHERNFFPFLLASISVLALNVTSRQDLKTVAIAYSFALVLSLPIGLYYNARSTVPPIHQTLFGRIGIANMVSTIKLNETRESLDREAVGNLAQKSLPISWVSEIREDSGTVDVIPWELSYVLEKKLKWNPNVTIQLFNSYTRVLDQWNGRYFAANNSPDFLILEFLAIDDRHILLDTPAVTRSIFRNYVVHRAELEKNLMLLRKRIRPLTEDATVIGQREIYLGEWVDVPHVDNLLFADVDISLSPFGSIAKILFRVPPVYIDAVYESGRENTYRITPEVANDGLLINYLPANQYDLFELLRGAPKDKVVRFRITGPGTFYYGQNASLHWKQAFSPAQLSQQQASKN